MNSVSNDKGSCQGCAYHLFWYINSLYDLMYCQISLRGEKVCLEIFIWNLIIIQTRKLLLSIMILIFKAIYMYHYICKSLCVEMMWFFKEQSKDRKQHVCGLNDDLVHVREEGLMFTCSVTHQDKKAQPLCYWVVG